MIHIRRDRKRVAVLWLRDGKTYHEIPEDDWPSVTHGDDDKACREWVELTGLTVTIRTEIQTSMDPST